MDKVHATATGLLADALAAAGHHLPMPCRGRHTCGKCGVYVAGAAQPPEAIEAALLARSPQPALPGYDYRLACLCHIDDAVSIVASSISAVVVADVGMDLVGYDGDEPESLGVAIDIGTTTVTVLAFRLGDRERLADVSALNHQAVHGADVLSRIDAANTLGVPALQRLIVGQLDQMIARVLDRAGARPTDVTRLTVTGNTTMLHLLTGRPVASLGVYPFTPQTLFGVDLPAAALFASLTRAECYLPPGISTFVGPDIVCGMLATGLGTHDEPELLVDVGTNGEMVLTSRGDTWCCSTAAGPAFEGAEISAGMPALPGAIEDVWVEGEGVGFATIGHKRPKGLCGTGLISAVDAFLTLGVIDGTGAMGAASAVIGRSGISISQADVRKLQLAKSAVAAGIDTLLSEAHLTAGELSALHLAGGFGSYLQSRPAAGIGLIPQALVDATDPAGNTALTGAVLLTLSRTARRTAAQRAAAAREVSLSTHPVFMDRYIENMAFRSETDD
ncbi:MAG: ASKHA domain-containing protein [Micrococcales bacterium]|nr:ASKHA domain-containing protein [Micrococcales bacterium]